VSIAAADPSVATSGELSARAEPHRIPTGGPLPIGAWHCGGVPEVPPVVRNKAFAAGEGAWLAGLPEPVADLAQ
jgi:hypothetical protein